MSNLRLACLDGEEVKTSDLQVRKTRASWWFTLTERQPVLSANVPAIAALKSTGVGFTVGPKILFICRSGHLPTGAFVRDNTFSRERLNEVMN